MTDERRRQNALALLFAMAFVLTLIAVAGRGLMPQSIAPQVQTVRPTVIHVFKDGACQGSGCLISSDGILFSAKHVTDGDLKATYTVTTDDGKQYKVKYALEDREADLSYMKLDLPVDTKPLPYAQLAQQDNLRVGDPVIIAGSPLGKDNINTFSLGIVSALKRDLDTRQGWGQYTKYQWHAMIQSTGPAFPGNSGGPVFNLNNEVVGVLVAGMAETLNYSVPVIHMREKVDAVRQWFALCRLRLLVDDTPTVVSPPLLDEEYFDKTGGVH